MKRNSIILLLAFLIISAVSCKKDDSSTIPLSPSSGINPNFNFSVTSNKEAFVILTTATWCHYCWEWGIPEFDSAFLGKNAVDPTKVNGLALHYDTGDPLFLQMAADIKTQFGIGGPPNLWIEFNNAYNLQPSGWYNAINTTISGPAAACGVNLNKVVSGTTSAKVYVKTKVFAAVTGTYKLAVYAVENGIVSTQTTKTGTDPNFVHKKVFRAEVSSNSPWGKAITLGAVGSENQYEFTYTPTSASGIKINNVSFVAVLYKTDASGKPTQCINSNTK